MARGATRNGVVSPVGSSVAEDIQRRMADPDFRGELERRAPFEALARLVITRRAALGISQEDLAARMGTSASAVSRIERGQHATNARTLQRLAAALDARAVLGFEWGTAQETQRELVVL